MPNSEATKLGAYSKKNRLIGDGMSNFVTLDFETANSNSHSICQIGVVNFEDSKEVSSWESFINPKDAFNKTNTRIHGIKAEDVNEAPTFIDVFANIKTLLANKIVVSHGSFDRTALKSAINKNGLETFDITWLDSTVVARRVLSQFNKKGYNLQNLARHYEIKTIPHNALNDAKTCGLILNKLLEESKKSIDEWLFEVNNPIKKKYSSDHTKIFDKLIPNEEGEFLGISLCVTGKLSFGNRQQTHKLISEYGFTIHNNLKSDTDYLLIGEQVAHNIGLNGKSNKEEEFEKAIEHGGKIRPISEADFKEMCGIDSNEKPHIDKRIYSPMKFDFEFNEEKFQELLSNPNIELELRSPDKRYEIIYSTNIVAKENRSPSNFQRNYYLHDTISNSDVASFWDTYVEASHVKILSNMVKIAKYTVTRISIGWEIICPRCSAKFSDSIWRNSPKSCMDQEHLKGCGKAFKENDKRMIPLGE